MAKYRARRTAELQRAAAERDKEEAVAKEQRDKKEAAAKKQAQGYEVVFVKGMALGRGYDLDDAGHPVMRASPLRQYELKRTATEVKHPRQLVRNHVFAHPDALNYFYRRHGCPRNASAVRAFHLAKKTHHYARVWIQDRTTVTRENCVHDWDTLCSGARSLVELSKTEPNGHYFANELKAKYGTGVIRTVRVGSLHRSVVIVPFQEHRLAREWEVAEAAPKDKDNIECKSDNIHVNNRPISATVVPILHRDHDNDHFAQELALLNCDDIPVAEPADCWNPFDDD